MKNFFRSTALVGLLLLFGPLGAPAQDCFTELWVQADQTSIHGNSMAYDPVTGSLLLPQISSPTGPVYVLDAADGTLTTKTLSTKGISFGSLGCFAIGADEGGRIYGLSDFGSRYMILWDGVDDDTPTSVPLEQGRLVRNYDVHGGANGEPTTIYATGSADYGPIEVFTCEPGGVPVLRETFGGGAATPGGKAGVASPTGYPADVVYGSDAVATAYNGIHIWTRAEGEMTYYGELTIPMGFDRAPTLALACDPENDGLIFALIGNGYPHSVMAINAKTWQMEGFYYLPVNAAVGNRGALIVDRKNKLLFWYGRPNSSTATAPLGHWGCLRYTVPPVRPTLTPTPSPTPSPTPVANPEEEIRALWVTRFDYTTTAAVRTIIQRAAEYHFNVVLFQTRGNATTFYPSALEPWAWELSGSSVENTGRDPGWDPLTLAIREAHAAGLQLQAYMNTYPGWKETIPPPVGVPQVWNTHREWFACAKSGATMWPSDWWTYWYTFLSPGHPEARAHIHAVYMEVLQRYPQIDGIHYDYIRYPSEVGDFAWNPVDVALFTAEAGGAPDDLPAEWAQWKRDQITKLVRENYNVGETIRRGGMFSGATLGNPSSGRNSYFQDSHAWLAEGIIDCVMPMLYTADTSYFNDRVAEYVAARNGRFVAPGIGVSSVTVDGLLEEIRLSRANGAQGVALFAYSTLFPGGVPNEKAQALLSGPFSNIATVPPMPWKSPPQTAWFLY